MYDRFTDRARKVMQLANQEAKRFNHEYIGTEHILLGLLQEGSGVAVNVLKNLGFDLRKIRLEVEKIAQSGPDMVTMAKLPQTPRARNVIGYAIEEASNLEHNHLGTEHLLLGLLREQEGLAGQVLLNLGLKLEEVREKLRKYPGYERGGVPDPIDPSWLEKWNEGAATKPPVGEAIQEQVPGPRAADQDLSRRLPEPTWRIEDDREEVQSERAWHPIQPTPEPQQKRAGHAALACELALLVSAGLIPWAANPPSRVNLPAGLFLYFLFLFVVLFVAFRLGLLLDNRSGEPKSLLRRFERLVLLASYILVTVVVGHLVVQRIIR
jgi:hypothetical protein